MPLMRFLNPMDPKWLSTLARIEGELIEDTLVHRYIADDGVPGKDSMFTTCSFWYVECLAEAEQIDEARLLFEKMLGYANHLGLYSE